MSLILRELSVVKTSLPSLKRHISHGMVFVCNACIKSIYQMEMLLLLVLSFLGLTFFWFFLKSIDNFDRL